jgi:hypothetical protein
VPHEPLGAVLILCGNVQKNHQDAKYKVHDMKLLWLKVSIDKSQEFLLLET